MSQLNREQIESALRELTDPHLNQDPVSAECVKDIRINGSSVVVDVVLGYAADQFKQGWAQVLQSTVEQVEGVSQAQVNVSWQVPAQPNAGAPDTLAQVKNVIAVASGKGGVGKSTTAANLALALAREGAKVGVLDADIYGPSQGIMFGIPAGTRPAVQNEKLFVPIEAMGVKVMSMAFLTDDNTAMAWRGPMAAGALQQLLTQTLWGELDYLVVDMPPGTGDIQLTLSQKVSVAGALIVTTPQDIALLDAKKGIEMFRKVNIPVLGVVENMAVHVCSNCGHIEHVFGEGGGERLAELYEVDLLASMPLSMAIRMQCDGGKPTTEADPDSQIAMIYQQLARTVGARLSVAAYAGAVPEIEID
ncbi:MAG: iron-sulfur cluster carrier protein ApbC [Thiopseudomonas sp.]|nr:iron-sulfur cluster carrier protein ApbC [Thiopseudomonas sp.]MCK9465399.1 iron-sulfur cluster carrier protein ApbC [Thiopseudomonas sp.]